MSFRVLIFCLNKLYYIMQNQKFNLVTRDKTLLIGRLWKPVNYPRIIVCMIHGIGEHSGKYEAWAQKFCESGMMVYSVDLRGHGLSEGKRGHINKLSDYFDDISSLLKRIKNEWGSLPVYIYGHSMGGNVVLSYLLDEHQDFCGAIITSPWLQLVKPPSSFLQKLAFSLDQILPSAVFKTGIKSSQLTSDVKLQEESDKDELMHGKISVRLYTELAKAATNVLEKFINPEIPVFLAHGTDDEITDFETTRNLAKRLGEQATFFKAEEARHELHLEPVADELFDALFDWIMDTYENA